MFPSVGVSNTDLRLKVEIKGISGTIVLNIPPPPSDRVWIGFRPVPKIQLSAHPIVGERNITMLRIMTWIEKRLLQEFQVSMRFPPLSGSSENLGCRRSGTWRSAEFIFHAIFFSKYKRGLGIMGGTNICFGTSWIRFWHCLVPNSKSRELAKLSCDVSKCMFSNLLNIFDTILAINSFTSTLQKIFFICSIPLKWSKT